MFAIRNRGPVTLCALALLGATASAADAHPRAVGSATGLEPVHDRARLGMRHRRCPKGLRPTGPRELRAGGDAAARHRSEEQDRLAVHQLRRSRWFGGRHHAGDRGRPVRRVPRPLRLGGVRPARHRRDARRRSTAKLNQERRGTYSQPFFEPGDDLWAYLRRIGTLLASAAGRSTPTCCRTRRPRTTRATWMGCADPSASSKLNYFGFSYGTFIGETYAALFPNRFRALVLDGALDPRPVHQPPHVGPARAERRLREGVRPLHDGLRLPPGFLHLRRRRPMAGLRQAGRARPTGRRSRRAADDPRPVDGEDILAAAIGTLYSKFAWTDLAVALNALAAGDGTRIRALANDFYGRRDDGTYDPGPDRYLALSAEQRYGGDLRTYLDARRGVLGGVRPLLVERGLRRAVLARHPRPGAGSVLRTLHGPGVRQHATGDRDSLRPGYAVPGSQTGGAAHGQRASADDERRWSHRVLSTGPNASTARSSRTSSTTWCRRRAPSATRTSRSRCRRSRRTPRHWSARRASNDATPGASRRRSGSRAESAHRGDGRMPAAAVTLRGCLAEPRQSKRGARFSRNAAMPSRASGVWLDAAMSSIA